MNVQFTIQEVTKNPGLYLPSRSIYCLKAYIEGANSGEMTDVWDALDGFYDWLVDTFSHKGASIDEVKLIMHYASTDPYDAFNQFFELLEAFYEDVYDGEEMLPFFAKIKDAPFDYLPQRTIHALYSFFWGVDMAAQGLIGYTDLNLFEEYLQDFYENSSSWYKIILLYSQDEFSALEQFQTLYAEFDEMPGHASDVEMPAR
jgi:hypothetical protein